MYIMNVSNAFLNLLQFITLLLYICFIYDQKMHLAGLSHFARIKNYRQIHTEKIFCITNIFLSNNIIIFKKYRTTKFF